MIEHISEVFSEVASTSDYSLIREKLSFEEKNYFLSNTSLFEFSDDISKIFEEDKQALFLANYYKNDEALGLLKQISNYDNVLGAAAISSLSDDSIKMQYLDKVNYNDIKETIILSFSNDENKIRCLDKVEGSSIFSVINSLKTDEDKIKCLDKVEGDFERSKIVETFDNDDDKIKGLNKIKDEERRATIISGFLDDEKKTQYLDSITSEYYKAIIVSSFLGDEKKIKCLDKIGTDECRKIIIETFDNDNDKIKGLNKIKDEECRATIISGFLDDEKKIQYLDGINNEQHRTRIILSFKNDEEKIRYLDKISTDEFKEEVITGLLYDEDKIRCLDKIKNDSYKAKIISGFKSKEKRIETLSRIKDGHGLSTVINSIGTDEELSEMLKGMNFEYYSAYEKIKASTSVADKTLLRLTYEDNETFRTVLENEEALNKFVEFFKALNESSVIDKSNIDSVLEAVILKEFSQKQADVWNIFSTIKGMADRRGVDDITRELYSILKYSETTKNFVGGDLQKFKNEFVLDSESLKRFVIDLVSGDVDTRKAALDRLKEITSQYINLKIEDYKIGRKKEIYDRNLLNINKKIDRNFLIKHVIENNDKDTLINLIRKFYSNRLTPDIESALEYRITDPKNAPKEVKAYFKEINNIFVDLYNNHYRELCNLFKIDEVEEIKYDENIMIDNSSVINLLFSTNNLNEVCHLCLHGNPLEYDRVINLIKKHHLMGLGNNFSKLFEEIGVTFSSYDVITNISKVAKKLGKIDIESMKLLDVLNLVTPTSELEELIGKENASLIVRNPTPNASTLSSGARIGMVCGYINKMYEKRGVNVPTIDTNYILESGKKMNVQVGNFTNPINLTYGERTGACMRIGGVGSGLFDFCLENKAGFHIKFSSESGEFVSRVSGFRVGNTLFLNELRNSCLEGFNNQDVIEACQRIAKDIIEESKKSEYPIENVVISDEFALKGSKSFINLDVSLDKDGVKTPGYYDVKPDKCVLLATSNSDNTREFVPFKDTPMPEYDVLRDKVQYMSDSDEIKSSINRIHMINEVLDGKELLELSHFEEDEEKKYIGAFVGEDFYVAVDKDGNIEDYIMPNTKDVERANKEARESLNKLKDAINRTVLENRTMTTMEPVYEEEEVIHHSRGHAMFVMIMIISFILSLTTIIIGVSKYIGK